MKYTVIRPEAVCDTECFINYWCCGFKAADGRVKVFEFYPGHPLQRERLIQVLRTFRIFGFNMDRYDTPMILLALRPDATNQKLKEASDFIAGGGLGRNAAPWQILRHFDLTIPSFMDVVDLKPVDPGSPTMPSLKLCGGRMHSRTIQEMPIDIEEYIGPQERQVILPYHLNDLETTDDMRVEMATQVKLRAIMSDRYNVDVRSKSDAQVAEAVIKAEIERRTGRKVYKPDLEPITFSYRIPSFVTFRSLQLRSVLGLVGGAKFKAGADGTLHVPAEMKTLKFTIGETTYKMGVGGLHSQEKSVSHYSDDEYVIKDRDVRSYYPEAIIQQGMYPKNLGPVFLEIYKEIYNERVAAKAAGEKDKAETLKIVLNGVFGKTNNAFSIFYSAPMFLQVTLTGQLAILMLIERLEAAGIRVISANTDGIVSKVPRHLIDEFEGIFKEWEAVSKFVTEETEYISLHSRDVNNYIALKRDEKTGKIEAKRKGTFTKPGRGQPGASGMKKNPDKEVCTEAVIAYLLGQHTIEDTIEWCSDVRKFVTVERVNGGAVKDDQFLGKVLRWYYAKGVTGCFTRFDNGNMVGDTQGAKLMMTLADHVPADVDYDYYIRCAYAMLEDIGVPVVDPALRGRRGVMHAQLPDQVFVHLVDLATGVALCGRKRASIRDAWVEHPGGMRAGMKMCPKCKKTDDI